MDKHDRDAMTLAIEQARAESSGRAQQIDAKLAGGEPWEKVGLFASSICQRKTLRLFVWQDPPCDGNAPVESADPDAKKLMQQMLAAGVSRYDPDPMAALQQVKRRR